LCGPGFSPFPAPQYLHGGCTASQRSLESTLDSILLGFTDTKEVVDLPQTANARQAGFDLCLLDRVNQTIVAESPIEAGSGTVSWPGSTKAICP
jgi:hypothetical protein